MFKKIKLCFAIWVLGLGWLVASYRERVPDEYNAFGESYERELTCCLKVIIDYHREHGITEENKQRILATVEKVKGKQDLLKLTKFFTEGLVSKEIESKDIYGNVIDSETIYTLFEEDGGIPELLKTCNEFKQRNYEVALNRFLQLVGISYYERERLEQPMNNKVDL